MKNLNEMSKAEMEQEISFAKEFVNNGGCMNKEQWARVFKMMQLVKEVIAPALVIGLRHVHHHGLALLLDA